LVASESLGSDKLVGAVGIGAIMYELAILR